jgi:hypothetical protein
MHFVSVLTGPDNTSDFAYFGFLRRGVYFHGGQKARVGKDAPSVKAFDWFWRHMAQGRCLDLGRGSSRRQMWKMRPRSHGA